MKRWLFRLLGVAVFVVILLRIDRAAVAATLQSVGWRVWAYNLALLAVVTVAKSLRWQLLLRPLTDYSLWRTILSFSSAGYLAMVTPGRVGDFMRAQFVKEETGVPVSAALGSVVLDRIFDLGLLAVVGGWGLTTLALGPQVTLLFLLLAGLLGVIAWVCTRTAMVAKIFNRVARSLPQRFAAMLAGGGETFTGYFKKLSWHHYLLAVLYTTIAYAVIFFQLFDFAGHMGIPLSWWQVCFFVSITTIISLVPVSIAGVGTRDLLYILMFAQIGLPETAAVAFAMIHFVLSVLSAIVIGVAAWQVRAFIYSK